MKREEEGRLLQQVGEINQALSDTVNYPVEYVQDGFQGVFQIPTKYTGSFPQLAVSIMGNRMEVRFQENAGAIVLWRKFLYFKTLDEIRQQSPF